MNIEKGKKRLVDVSREQNGGNEGEPINENSKEVIEGRLRETISEEINEDIPDEVEEIYNNLNPKVKDFLIEEIDNNIDNLNTRCIELINKYGEDSKESEVILNNASLFFDDFAFRLATFSVTEFKVKSGILEDDEETRYVIELENIIKNYINELIENIFNFKFDILKWRDSIKCSNFQEYIYETYLTNKELHKEDIMYVNSAMFLTQNDNGYFTQFLDTFLNDSHAYTSFNKECKYIFGLSKNDDNTVSFEVLLKDDNNEPVFTYKYDNFFEAYKHLNLLMGYFDGFAISKHAQFYKTENQTDEELRDLVFEEMVNYANENMDSIQEFIYYSLKK